MWVIAFDLLGILASGISVAMALWFYRANEGRYRTAIKYFAGASFVMFAAFTADLLIARLALVPEGPVDLHHLLMTISTIGYLVAIQKSWVLESK